jgi:hypothetical protein
MGRRSSGRQGGLTLLIAVCGGLTVRCRLPECRACQAAGMR